MILSRLLLFISIALIPLQVFAIPVRSTLLDISVVFFILCYFASSISSLKIFGLSFIALIAYSFFASGIWSISVPLVRIISSSFFFSFLFSVYFRGKNLPSVDIKLVFIAIDCSTILSFISLLMFWIGLNPFDRTGVLFSERSFACLFYCASFSFYLFEYFQLSSKFSNVRAYYVLFSLLICLSGVLSFSSIHPFSLLIALLIVLLPLIYKALLKIFSSSRISQSILYLILFLIPFFIIFVPLLLSTEHLADRFLSLFGQTVEVNLSSLVYLSGLYQLSSSLELCPLTGCGAGSPGYLGVNILSYISRLTPNVYMAELASRINTYDLYSLFFRSIVELGPIIGLLACLLVLLRLARSFNFSPSNSDIQSCKSLCISSFQCQPINFFRAANSILIWSLVFLVGSLLKEPHLFRSITFVPISLGLWISGNLRVCRKTA